MISIFVIAFPVFVLTGVGFVAGRAAGGPTMVRGLSRFLADWALPALLFTSTAGAGLPGSVEWGFIAAFFIAAFAVFAVGAGWMWGLRERENLAPVGFAASFSNIGLIGAPIIMDAYGPTVAVPVMLLIVFQSPLLFTTATLLSETRRGRGSALVSVVAGVRASLVNPVIVSMAVGLAVNGLDLQVPEPIWKALDLLARTVLPCASFASGAALAEWAEAARSGRAGGVLPRALVMTVLKTAVHPALTWVLAIKVFALSPVWAAAAVTAAALPIGVNAYAFAERHGSGRDLVSLSLMMSTVVSPLTISTAFLAVMG